MDRVTGAMPRWCAGFSARGARGLTWGLRRHPSGGEWSLHAVKRRPDASRLREWPWKAIVAAVLLLGGLALLSSRVDVEQVHERTQALNGAAVFALVVLLPLLGFPVSVMHVLAGIRWGTGVGFALVVASILLQLLASYGLVHLARPLFERKLQPVLRRLPDGEHGALCAFTLLLPGVPYFLKNYALPVARVPLLPYLLWCFPIHAVRASIAVFFGDASDQLTPPRIAGIALYAITITLLCAWAFRRLRRQLQPAT